MAPILPPVSLIPTHCLLPLAPPTHPYCVWGSRQSIAIRGRLLFAGAFIRLWLILRSFAMRVTRMAYSAPPPPPPPPPPRSYAPATKRRKRHRLG